MLEVFNGVDHLVVTLGVTSLGGDLPQIVGEVFELAGQVPDLITFIGVIVTGPGDWTRNEKHHHHHPF